MVDMSSLFQSRDFEDEEFYFDDIIVQPPAVHLDKTSCIVEFHYSFCDDTTFQASITIEGSLSVDNFSSIFAIGMYGPSIE
jgi:hypothetical protein